MYTFHVVSLPHTQTTSDFTSCAYTQKVIKFCNMMKSLGHKVILYASEENEADCDEVVTCITKKEQEEIFGKYDHKKEFYKITWGPDEKHWVMMNGRAIAEIAKRKGDRDFICVIAGLCQKQVADAFPTLMTVEFGIGYQGVFSKYRVFESYAWMHYVHGLSRDDNGHFFDAVIPNYFDPADFPYSSVKDDYFLYVGRFIKRKGVDIAVEVCKALKKKLIIAGQGARQEGNKIIGSELTIEGSNIEYIGHIDTKKRGELMSRAKAVFLPTTYLEPFGGTSIEPLFCGTPVITTDWGAFPENIVHGEIGYRARTLGEFIWAAEHVHLLNSKKIRDYAIANFSTGRVKDMYQAYFDQLFTLWGDGWYTKNINGYPKRFMKVL